MLNPFPDLLAFALIAPTLLRLVLGVILIMQSKKMVKKSSFEQILKIIYFIGGILLILGAFTQYSAILISLALVYQIFYEPSIKENRLVYVLMLTMTISLLFLGAGFFAFDLPL